MITVYTKMGRAAVEYCCSCSRAPPEATASLVGIGIGDARDVQQLDVKDHRGGRRHARPAGGCRGGWPNRKQSCLGLPHTGQFCPLVSFHPSHTAGRSALGKPKPAAPQAFAPPPPAPPSTHTQTHTHTHTKPQVPLPTCRQALGEGQVPGDVQPPHAAGLHRQQRLIQAGHNLRQQQGAAAAGQLMTSIESGSTGATLGHTGPLPALVQPQGCCSRHASKG